jgi:DNA-binding GntR family transcriptional regulator
LSYNHQYVGAAADVKGRNLTLVHGTSAARTFGMSPTNARNVSDHAYVLVKGVIADTEIYNRGQELRLDERELGIKLGVGRAQICEALSMLEQEGYLRASHGGDVYIVRRPKREIIEIIQMWAALESLAVRLAALRAEDAQIAALRRLFDEFQNPAALEHLDRYSRVNIAFHESLIALSGSQTLVDEIGRHYIHVRAIRRATITQFGHATCSIVDHLKIIEALERRETEVAERLSLEHTLDLTSHVERLWAFTN